MIIHVKNKDTLLFDDFIFKCCIGKKGFTNKKIEGDKKTPLGKYSLGPLFYRKDRNKKPETKLKIIEIKKNMGWCDDVNHKRYNKLVNINKKIKCEKIFRKDYKYDYMILIKYNYNRTKKNKGSAIFLHLTKDYKKTLACIGVNKKDFEILLKIINKKTKIKIG